MAMKPIIRFSIDGPEDPQYLCGDCQAVYPATIWLDHDQRCPDCDSYNAVIHSIQYPANPDPLTRALECRRAPPEKPLPARIRQFLDSIVDEA